MTLLEAAAKVATFLQGEGIPYFIMGGMAVQQWGEPRMTHDVDVTVLVTQEELPRFVDKATALFLPRIPNARAFALKHRVLLVKVDDSVPVDISLGIPGYEDAALSRAIWVDFPQAGSLRLVGPEDLIIHKCVAGRPRDVEDVEGVLIRQKLELEMDLVREWLAQFQHLVDTHDPLELFEQALARARAGLTDNHPA